MKRNYEKSVLERHYYGRLFWYLYMNMNYSLMDGGIKNRFELRLISQLYTITHVNLWL